MAIVLQKYPFTPILGWSISRYDTFSRCKRLYFYSYYSRYVPNVSSDTMKRLSSLTSIPLEIGNVVHDCVESLLKRLQKSDSEINLEKFFQFAIQKTGDYFGKKEFIESYYGHESVDLDKSSERVCSCLENFRKSVSWEWIMNDAIRSRNQWLIEPDGFGETRLNGLKAYCKMDFLIPLENKMYILDWKTGKMDAKKHTRQLLGYSAAAVHNFGIDIADIEPKIVYLSPNYSELSVGFSDDDYSNFFLSIFEQTQQMYSFCSNHEKNIPMPIDKFPLHRSPGACGICRYQELCAELG